MTSQYRHRRTSNPATPAPNPLEPGEIAVNTANRQLHLGDAASATLGAPKPLLPIRYFDTTAQYVANDFVVNGDSLYRAKTFTGPGVFVTANWDMMVGSVDPQYVAKAGDTMTGALSLPAAAPTAPVHATNKAYVDALVALKANVIVSPTKPSPDPNDSTLWYDSQGGQLYIRYNDGNSTAWVIAAPQPDSSNYVSLIGSSAVRYDAAQALTDPQQAQGRQNVYAAPFDAMAYNGMQVNGSFDVSQENGDAVQTVNFSFVCDNWSLNWLGAALALFGVRQNVSVWFPYNKNILSVGVATAVPSLAAGDTAWVSTSIEGYRMSRLGWGTAWAQPITLAFWTTHTVPGTYTGTIRNSAADRCYAFAYTQDASNGAEYKIITIPGDTAGVWNTDNGVGMYVGFAVASGGGSNAAPSLNNWLAGNYLAGPGQVNGVASTSNYFRFGSVMVLPGTEAPSAARSPLIMRPYDQELMTCRRYWQCSNGDRPKGFNIGTVNGPSMTFSNVSFGYYKFTPRMRTVPTVTLWNDGVQNQMRNDLTGAVATLTGVNANISSDGLSLVQGTNTPLQPNGFYSYDLIMDARI